MRSFLIALLLSWPAMAIEIWYPQYDARMTTNREAELAGFAEWVGESVNMRVIDLSEYSARLRNPSERTLAQIPSPLFHRAMEAGWVPILRFDRLIEAKLFSIQSEPELAVVATPPSSSVVSVLAGRTFPDATLIETLNHGNCLRAVVIGDANACMTFDVFVRRYKASFGIEFEQVGMGYMAPPVSLFASPDLAETLVARTNPQTSIPAVKPFSYVQFIPESDMSLFDSLK